MKGKLMDFEKLKKKFFDFLFEDEEKIANENVEKKEVTPKIIEKVEEPKNNPPVFIDVKKTEEKKPEEKVEKIIEKPVKEKVEVFEPYELKEILSPFYGNSKPEEIKVEPVKTPKTTAKKETIISPFFGYDEKAANDMREETKTLYRRKKVVEKCVENSVVAEKPTEKKKRGRKPKAVKEELN